MPRYTFGPFTLDMEARSLLRDGEPISMTGKTLDVLVVLVQNRGRLVDKDELLSRVWAGTIVEEASLSRSIFTVRKILGDSPRDHCYIATIAGRGYQFVAPVTELTGTAPQTAETAGEVVQEPTSDSVIITSLIKRHMVITISAIAVAVAAVGVLWFVLHRPSSAPAELVERRLTFNSGASPIESAALSRDGKYLAYSDPAGIHVRLLSTGEDRLIQTSAVSPAGALSVDSWFPDGAQLLVHSEDAGGHRSMWAISVMGQSSRELRSDTVGWEVSPDGTRIAFSPARSVYETREIWVMDSHGDNLQKVVGLAVDEFLQFVHWSPDGQRMVYIRAQPYGQLMETCDLKGANRTAVVASDPGHWLNSIYWLPDRRIVYSQGVGSLDENLWQIGVNAHGTPIGKPRRITRSSGSDLLGLSASADGRRLVMRKVTYPAQVYIGELPTGPGRMSTPQRLTHDEAFNWATAWTADSKAVLFNSNRGGDWGIFKQEIGKDTAEPLVEGRQFADLPRLSPDGAWVLYREISRTSGQPPRFRLTRVPVTGGLPNLVMEMTGAWDDRCARAPETRCVIFEESQDQKRLMVTAFDPLGGKGAVLRTIAKDVDIKEGLGVAMSPDGSTVAVARTEEPEVHIRLLSLTGESDRQIAVKNWPNLAGLDWSADGKGIYVGSTSSRGGTLLYVDLKGTVQVLWQTQEGAGGFFGGIPSPDGRYLALRGANGNSTAWMLEGF
jgi:DNA-binding winged helix-turn-helix (wHTH) protein/Tol biopolymer transport system component